MKLHHANILVGEERTRDFVFEIIEKDLFFNIKANPDFFLVEIEAFSIDDARKLIQWTSTRPLVGENKVYVVISKSISFEAQNALLKVLEEPPVGTYIFMVLQSLGSLLPTFISRVRILNSLENSEEKNINAMKFIEADIQERFKMIGKISKKEDKSDMKNLIKDLEQAAYQMDHNGADRVLSAKIFAAARGSSPKMILEWLATVI